MYTKHNPLRKIDVAKEKKKIDFSQGNATAFWLGIIDSLYSSDEDVVLVSIWSESGVEMGEGEDGMVFVFLSFYF